MMRKRGPAGVACVLAALAALGTLACSGGRDGGGDGRAARGDILTLIRRSNDLARTNYDLQCALCPCGAFSDVSPESEECLAEVATETPALADAFAAGLECSITQLEARRSCLEAATSCDTADTCDRDDTDPDCESVAEDHGIDTEAFFTKIVERCGSLQ